MIRKIRQALWNTIRSHRIAVIVIASVVVLVAVYIFWSRYTWNEYVAGYTEWHSSVHGQLDDALALPAKTDQQRSAKFTALKNVSNTMTKAQDSLCRANSIVSWQQFIKLLDNRVADCSAMIANTNLLNKGLQKAALYLENEKLLAGIISNAHSDKTELSEGDWDAQAAVWHNALEKTSKITASEAFVPTKKVAEETVKGISSAWQGVVAAHKAKDKAAYTKAQALLVQAYGALGNIADSSDKQLKILLDSLQVQYKASFKQ